jgi:hypothetical protein
MSYCYAFAIALWAMLDPASVGYASSSEPLVRFGLGPHTGVKQVEVRWPGGGSQKLTGATGDRIIEIDEVMP